MLGILAGSSVSSVLIGDESIQKRPMRRVTDPLKQMGAKLNWTRKWTIYTNCS